MNVLENEGVNKRTRATAKTLIKEWINGQENENKNNKIEQKVKQIEVERREIKEKQRQKRMNK